MWGCIEVMIRPFDNVNVFYKGLDGHQIKLTNCEFWVQHGSAIIVNVRLESKIRTIDYRILLT